MEKVYTVIDNQRARATRQPATRATKRRSITRKKTPKQVWDDNHSITQLMPKGDVILEEMIAEGFNESLLLTLQLPHSVARPGSSFWFEKEHHKFCCKYGRTYQATLEFRAVATRGPTGLGVWSCHVVYRGDPKHLHEFARWWNERHGRTGAVVSDHPNCLRYWVKNYMEPDSEMWDGKHNKKRPEPVAPSVSAIVGSIVSPESEDFWALGPDDL